MSRPSAFEAETVADGKTVTCYPVNPSTKQRMTFRSFIDLLTDSTRLGLQFKSDLTNYLIEHKFDFFFECPPITTEGYSRDSTEFEFSLVRSDEFKGLSTDLDPFSQQFLTTIGDIAVFPNLSGDTQLVVPKPLASTNLMAYSHFANFLRYGEKSQILSLWSHVGNEMKRLLTSANSKVYFSTSGLGVSYLHVRLSKIPKYYQVRRYSNL